ARSSAPCWGARTLMRPLNLNLQPSELDDHLDAFEEARRQGQDADLADFLPERESPLYLSVLRELVRVDLEWCREQGWPRKLADSQPRFPELSADAGPLHDVAFEEYRLRRADGEAVSAEEYRRRFGVDTAGWPESQRGRPAPARPEFTATVRVQEAA